MNRKLVIDVGMNDGGDTKFYLKKGFRVVAIEANPDLAARVKDELREHIDSGALTILNIGVGSHAGTLPFYKNLDNDHWSSFDRAWGTRQATRYETIDVVCQPFRDILRTHGMPYYLKIDVEGFDLAVLKELANFEERPRYLSIEESEASYFAELWALGYRDFKLVNQAENHLVALPEPAKEGDYAPATFTDRMSGPFGEESPGDWLPFDAAMHFYLTQIRQPVSRAWLAPKGSWFDIHARFPIV